MRYSKAAAIIGTKPLFREFLTFTTKRPVPDEKAAAAELRNVCEVMSRRELDTNIEAGRIYLYVIERFNHWLGVRNATP